MRGTTGRKVKQRRNGALTIYGVGADVSWEWLRPGKRDGHLERGQ